MSMKRIDLFLSERELDRVCKALRKAGAPGYSVMRHVTGMGVGGEISEAMDFSSFGANAHLIVFCKPEQLTPIQEAVRPLLQRFGGVGFLSEAEPF
jgi:nitrogen regulatory protein PII